MRGLVLGALLAALPLVVGPTARAAEPSYDAQVVELSATYQAWEPRQPWSKSPPRTRTAMAVVVEGGFLLTAAQMVGDATLLRVGKGGSPPREPARVVHVDPEVNLALVAVDAPGFFEGLSPVVPAEGVPTQGAVRSARWRNGQFEVSSSRVGRVEVRPSHTGNLEHVFLRVKSDLGGGGWAEPVFEGDRFLGLTVSQSDDLGNVIPAEVIRAYLASARDAEGYTGFGALGFSWQPARNPALTRHLGLEGEPRGVLVLGVPWGASGCGELQPHDLLLALDGRAIDADGFFLHPRYGRQAFAHVAVEGHRAGDDVPARVLRAGQVVDVDVTLRRYPASSRLIPGRQADRPPPYLVVGGLVFRELDGDYLAAWGEDWASAADTRLVTRWELDRHSQGPGRRRVVLLAYVLPAPYNQGYHGLSDLAVEAVNGVAVDSIADLEEGFRSPQGPFHRISLSPNPARAEIVLDARTFAAASAEILAAYGVPEPLRLPGKGTPEQTPNCP